MNDTNVIDFDCPTWVALMLAVGRSITCLTKFVAYLQKSGVEIKAYELCLRVVQVDRCGHVHVNVGLSVDHYIDTIFDRW